MPDHDPAHIAAQSGEPDQVADAADRGELPPLRSFNAFAAFDRPDPARELILTLERSGIDGRHISAVELTDATSGREQATDADTERREAVEEDIAAVHQIGVEGAKGGSIGAVLGALGGTAVALAIPGVGAAMGAGILAVTAGGAVAGAGVGTFAGALGHTPATRSWERALVDIEDGQIVIGVHTDDDAQFDTAVRILSDASPRRVRRLDRDGEPL